MKHAFTLLCILVATAFAPAAPPVLTSLFPAGAQRGTTAEVAAAGTFDPWPVSFWVSGKGVSVEPGKDKGKLTVKIAADAEPGVYWLRAHNAEGASPVRPFVVGLIPEVEEQEPNDEPGKPHLVSGPSVTVNGRLAKTGDVDGFAVKLKKGETLVASLEANRLLKSPMDAVLQVVSEDGFVLAVNNDFRGLDPQLAFAAPKDGTYIARVFAFPSAPDSSIRFAGGDAYLYRLTLTTAGYVDFPVPLAVQAGYLEESVELHGWNVAGKAVRIRKVPIDRSELVLVGAGLANPIRLLVEPHRTHGFLRKATPLAPPFSATGRIEKPGDEVEFIIVGKKGTPLALRVESRSLGLPVDPVIRVLGLDKAQLAKAEPSKLGGDTVLSFAPPADGFYTVVVSDLFGGGSPRHTFLLRVPVATADYELAVLADRFAVPPGKPLDIPIKVVRKAGFKSPIEIVGEGLPEGVKLEVKPPAGKVDPNAITVTLTADKTGVSVPFRLVGKVVGEPLLSRVAVAPIAEYELTTVDLWLSVSESPVTTPVPKKKK